MSARDVAAEMLELKFSDRRFLPVGHSYRALRDAANRCARMAARLVIMGDPEALEWAQAWELLDTRYGTGLEHALARVRVVDGQPGL
ncbi:MAG: hypothetical protein FWF90_17445 [Promicromonosporaceae bacterium]|nr:hypothetical protein [Promicromonosporaceae bacterium]